MKLALLEMDAKPEWRPALEQLIDELAAAGTKVVQTNAWDDADAWLVCAGSQESLELLLSRADARTRHSTIVLGVALPWPPGVFVPAPGTLGHLLETFEVAAAVAAPGLIEWRNGPSCFAGRKDLMAKFATNPMKATQSDRYAYWVRAPGESLASSVLAYLAAVRSLSAA